jgi:hypothetical protein
MKTTLIARLGLLLLCALLLPGCGKQLVRYQHVEVPGPVRYVGIPSQYTEDLELPAQPMLRCQWRGEPTTCNDDLRAERDALRDIVDRANADRKATRDLSGRALKRNRDHGRKEGQDEGEAGGEGQ